MASVYVKIHKEINNITEIIIWLWRMHAMFIQFMMFQSKIKINRKQHAVDHGFEDFIIIKYSFVDRFPAVSASMRIRLHTLHFN